MSNMINARAWAKNTLITGNRHVVFTLEDMNRQSAERGEEGLNFSIAQVDHGMDSMQIMNKVERSLRRSDIRLVIYMVGWGFTREQGYSGLSSREALKEVVIDEMTSCKNVYLAAQRRNTAFLFYPGVTDSYNPPSLMGKCSKMLNDLAQSWMREKGFRWETYWANVGGGVRDRIGNIPPLAFVESLDIVLNNVQSKGRLFDTVPSKKKAKHSSGAEASQSSQSKSPSKSPPATKETTIDGDPWISESHAKCYSEIKRKENEIACLHVQIAQSIERYRSAEARRIEAEDRYKELWKSFEATMTRKQEVQGHWGGSVISPTSSRPMTPRDLSAKSPVSSENRIAGIAAPPGFGKTSTPMTLEPPSPQLEDLMDDENLILGEDLLQPDTKSAEDREYGGVQEEGMMGGEGSEAPM